MPPSPPTEHASRRPLRVINSHAPMRVCDNGGWTDTWFAKRGRVFSIAVNPYAEVQMRVFPREAGEPPISIFAENYGDRYVLAKPEGIYDKHPLLEAAFDYMHVPADVAVEVSIFSEAPSGCSTGTSAAVSVALLGALDRLTPGRLSPHEIALAAQKIETDLLGQQCGVQDQVASAYGGINDIEIIQYPHVSVSPLRLPDPLLWELEARLTLIFVGESHVSSDVHRQVIQQLEGEGADSPRLEPLRATAARSKDALYRGDFDALGRVMIDNTHAQAGLHEELIGKGHREIIDIARQHHAVGWKVNGAGGDGGSVTLLSGAARAERREMIRHIRDASEKYIDIPITLNHTGLRVWEAADPGTVY